MASQMEPGYQQEIQLLLDIVGWKGDELVVDEKQAIAIRDFQAETYG